MTTPRKNWCKLYASLRHEPWNNDQVAFFARLKAELTGQWAEHAIESGDDLRVSKRGLCAIAGKGRFDVALKLARSLAEVSSISARLDGEVVLISWPKFWETQSFGARETPRRERKRKRESKEDPRPPAAPVLPAESLTLSRLLIELLRDTPGAHIPPRAERQWATYIARMPREIPELAAATNPWETIEGAIRWALGPENLGQPYEVVIRSGRALLEKYPKLRAAERRKRRSSGDDVDAALLRAAQGGET